MPFPAVYGTYDPEPMLDDTFASIAKAADDEMIDVLTRDLDPLDVADADIDFVGLFA